MKIYNTPKEYSELKTLRAIIKVWVKQTNLANIQVFDTENNLDTYRNE